MCDLIEEFEGRGIRKGNIEYSRAVVLIRQGIETIDGLVSNGISEETARMALEAMLQPV